MCSIYYYYLHIIFTYHIFMWFIVSWPTIDFVDMWNSERIYRRYFFFQHHTGEKCISLVNATIWMYSLTRRYRLTGADVGISRVKYVYCDSYSCMEMRVSKLSAQRAVRRMADGNTIFRYDRDYKAHAGVQFRDWMCYLTKISIKILINRASPVTRHHTMAKRRADRFSINPNRRISGVAFSVKGKQLCIKYILLYWVKIYEVPGYINIEY